VRAVIARTIAAAALLASTACASSEPDLCTSTATCLRLNVDGLLIGQIDQLELDVVIGGTTHSTVITGTRGQRISLPTSTSITLAIPVPLLSVDLIAAGRRDGQVVGLDGASVMVLGGNQQSVELELREEVPCTEGHLDCGHAFGVPGQASWLYRCTDQVPLFYARCLRGCTGGFGSDADCFDTGCTDGGHYCGGNKLEGDPNTLYLCDTFRATMPTTCPHGCAISGDGHDACN
jgi:hypothetical protein